MIFLFVLSISEVLGLGSSEESKLRSFYFVMDQVLFLLVVLVHQRTWEILPGFLVQWPFGSTSGVKVMLSHWSCPVIM